jgi:hypothetical protein
MIGPLKIRLYFPVRPLFQITRGRAVHFQYPFPLSIYDIRSSELLDNLNWKPLEERRNYLKSIFIYKILNGHTAPSLKEAFQFNNERHNTYNLRNRDTDLAPPMPKKEFGKRCFSYNGALHWNNLPHEAKIAESLSSFKSILKQRMS